jgi:hypothetical protein
MMDQDGTIVESYGILVACGEINVMLCPYPLNHTLTLPIRVAPSHYYFIEIASNHMRDCEQYKKEIYNS